MQRHSFSVEKAIECFIFECSCSNMIVASTDKKRKKKGREEKHILPAPVVYCTSTYSIHTEAH